MAEITKVRIDKYLWSVRLYKSRSLATEACDGGKVKVNGTSVKPSASVKLGDMIHARAAGRERIIKVLALLDKRVGAALVVDYMEDLSPEPVKETFYTTPNLEFGKREKGSGRPTKLDRRVIEEFYDGDEE